MVLSRRILLVFCQDTGRSWTQIKVVTGADCIKGPFKGHISLFVWEHQTCEVKRWKKVLFYDGKKRVLRASDVTVLTSHFRCCQHGAVKGGYCTMVWVLYASRERCSFRLCRAVRQQLAGCVKLLQWHPSWLGVLFCVVRTGFFNRTTLQFTAAAWQRLLPGQ